MIINLKTVAQEAIQQCDDFPGLPMLMAINDTRHRLTVADKYTQEDVLYQVALMRGSRRGNLNRNFRIGEW